MPRGRLRVASAVPVNATVPAVGPDQVPAVLARFDGCTTAKVKVAERGQTLADDLDRVAAVRDAMGASARIRVDANGGWSLEQAVEALGKLAAYDLEYAEQPCATVDELASLRRALVRSGIDVPVAADESIRKAEDPLLVARREAADLVVVKVAPLGGVARALEIVDACGLPGRRVVRARHEHRHRRGGRARGRPARPRPRVWTRHGRPLRARRGPLSPPSRTPGP